jgi:hypothetical protein
MTNLSSPSPPSPKMKAVPLHKDDNTKLVIAVLKSCGCLQYEKVLLSEGFDRLESLLGLEKDDVTALGMSEREGDLIRRAAEKMVKGRKK